MFTFVRDRIGDGSDRHILSFDCSLGEEVFALRRWFPHVWISGIDVNPYSIAQSRIRWWREGCDSRISFTVDETTAEVVERYDAIFCSFDTIRQFIPNLLLVCACGALPMPH